MVVFEDGKPKPAHYRRFKIKTVDGVDDFESIREVLRRRFKRLATARAAEKESKKDAEKVGEGGKAASIDSFGVIPDLVLIDGGKGQLSAALEVFLEMGIDDIPLASLAKENEELFVPHTPEPIILPRDSQALYLVQRIRDEAHRFAITFHRNLRSKASLKSPIDNVTGIGPKRKRMLMRRFGTLKGIKEAAVDDLASVPGMTRSLAIRLKQTI
jgi:excinuclease ABC subunit C